MGKGVNHDLFFGDKHLNVIEKRLREYVRVIKSGKKGEFVGLSACNVCESCEDETGMHQGCSFCLLHYEDNKGRQHSCMYGDDYIPASFIRSVSGQAKRLAMLKRHVRKNGFEFKHGVLEKKEKKS